MNPKQNELKIYRSFGIRDIFIESINTFFGIFWFIFWVSTIIYLPFNVIKYLLVPDAFTNYMADIKFGLLFSPIVDTLMLPIMIYGIDIYLKTEENPSVWKAFANGFKQWWAWPAPQVSATH